jgi:electron transfer flavoprotein beta subunit
MLNIVVCIKQVLDPEAPASTYRVSDKQVTQAGVPPVINPFDANALEAALRIKDVQPAKITILSMGRNLSKAVLRKGLAAGGDELILLEDNLFNDLDAFATALLLAAAIKKIGIYDIIFTGRQAADTNGGIVGSGIAELLGIPSLTAIRKVEVSAGRARAEQVQPDGFDVVEAPLPTLITVSNELGELRMIGMREIMAAQKKAITVWDAAFLAVDFAIIRRSRLLSLSAPKNEVTCDLISGTSAEQMGSNLALKLKEKKLI